MFDVSGSVIDKLGRFFSGKMLDGKLPSFRSSFMFSYNYEY